MKNQGSKKCMGYQEVFVNGKELFWSYEAPEDRISDEIRKHIKFL